MATATLAVENRESKQVASYAGSRPDVLAHVTSPRTVLDVGCNEGALARDLKDRFPGVRVWGLDINPDSIARAGNVLEAGYSVNLDNHDLLRDHLGDLTFDTIIAADVLEHTIDPWKTVRFLSTRLNDGGELLISLPNLGHWETIWHLIRQRFPRRSRGVYDDTHLRFFMRGNLREFEAGECQMSLVQRNFRLWERRQTIVDHGVRACIGWIPWVREYFVFQYIIRVKKVVA